MLGFPMFNPATPDVWKMNTPYFPFVTPGLFPASAPSSPTNVDAEAASSQQSEASYLDKEKVGPMFPAREKPLSDTQKQIVRGPLDYLLKSPGKDIRRKFIQAFNEWLRIPEDKLNIITEIVGLLHTASLLIDDIQDNSKLRRGLPVAHSIFGIAQTINSANYAYFLAQERLRELNHPEAYEIYTEELLRLHRGQGMDLYWRDCLTCPTEEDYIEMIANKTGGLFRLAIKLMQLESETKSNVIELADLLGVIFQIRDDYENLQSGLYTKNKGFCEDLTEGKFSFLIIHSINSNPNNHHLLNILRQRSEDDSVKKYAVEYIDSTGSFDYCRERLTSLLKEADQMVKKLENEAGQSKGIYDILSFLS